MALHCVNFKSNEVKDLAEQLGVSPLVASAKIGVWQEENNSYEFPTAYQLQNPTTIKEKVLSNLQTSNDVDSIFTYADQFLDDTIKVESDETTLQGNGAKTLLKGFMNRAIAPTVSQLLDNVINIPETSTLALQLVQKAKNVMDKVGTKIQFVEEDDMTSPSTIMQYDAVSNEIWISKDRLSKYTEKEAVIALLHEIAHAKTVAALSKPQTIEEVDFNNTVEQFYNKYKRSSLQSEYGFKDKFEFVAEMYGNPEFADAVKNLSESWFKNFIAALRRMFVSGNPREYDAMFEQIVYFVENRNEVFRPTDKVFMKEVAKGDVELDTLSKRVDYTVNKVKDAVQHSYNKFKNTSSKKGKERAQALKELNKKLDEFGKAKKWHAILEYVKDFKDTVYILDNKLKSLMDDVVYKVGNKEYKQTEEGYFQHSDETPIYHRSLFNKLTDKEVRKSIVEKVKAGEIIIDDNLYDDILKSAKNAEISADKIYEFEQQLATYDTLADIEKLIDDAVANINELGVEDRQIREEVRSVVNSYRGVHESINNVLESLKRKAVIDTLSQSYYNTKVETDWRNKLYKEYSDNNIKGISKDQYVSQQLATTYKDEYEKDLREAAIKLANDPTMDISSYELNAADNLNIKSRLVQITTNMVMKMRDSIQAYMKDIDLNLADLQKEFKDVRSGKMSKVFENLYEQDEKGNYYLKTRWSVKFKDARDKVINEIRNDVDGDNKTFAMSKHAVETLVETGKGVTARNEGSYHFNEGDNLRVLQDINITGEKVDVNKIHKYENYEDLTTTDKEAIASLLGYSSFEAVLESAKPNSAIRNFVDKGQPLHLIEYELDTQKVKPIKGFIYKTKKYKTWSKENTQKIKNKIVPAEKYRNKPASALENKVLAQFMNITKNSHNQTNGIGSLIYSVPKMDATFYKIPTKVKTDTERIMEGEILGTIKDNLTDITNVKADEIGYERLDSQGNPLKSVKVHFRGGIKPEDQSLDLFTVYRNEAWNGFNYAIKKNHENSFNLLVDLAKSKKYFNVSKKTGKKLINIFSPNKTPELVSGELSNEFKKLQGIVETNIYDILNEHAGTILGADVNKLSNAVSGIAASTMLTGNIFSAVGNLTNGYSQLIFNAIGGKNINFKSLGKAEALINKDLPAIMLDITNPVKTSFTHQVLELFDMTNSYGFQIQDFIKDTATKALLDKHNLGVLNNVGEFKMAGMLTMAMLDELKVMNENHEYIDKKGNVVTEADAASLLDMLEKNANGKLVINSKVAFTKQNLTNNIHHGGKTAVNLLIRKRSHDIFGVYSNELAPELQKKFYGKLLLMFKKFLLPGLQARYKGISVSGKSKEDLTEDDVFYSDAEKDYIEGYYTTFMRMTIQLLRNHSLNFTKDYFSQLNDYEKANLKKATSELVIAFAILPILGGLLGAAGDDDDDTTIFLMYQMARLQNELQAFVDPTDTYKTLSNPFAGLRFVQNVTNVVADIATPLKLFPEQDESHFDYINTDSRGNNILWKHTKKALPIVNQFDKDTKELIKAFNR